MGNSDPGFSSSSSFYSSSFSSSSSTSSSSSSSIALNTDAKKRQNENIQNKIEQKNKTVSVSLNGGDVSGPEKGSHSDSDMDMYGGDGNLSDQYDLSPGGSQEGDDIFELPPGQSTFFDLDLEMKDATNGEAPAGGLGQDQSKPGSEPNGSLDADKSGLKNKKKVAGGPRTSARESKQPLRFDPNNSATYKK